MITLRISVYKLMEKTNSSEVRKGAWTQEEDDLLRTCVQKHGEGKWHLVPQRAGLNRCRKSCRIRWLNYLKPNINRGNFTEDEVDMILRLHKLLGNRWSLIAGRLAGRTANDVKNFWHTKIRNETEEDQRKKAKEMNIISEETEKVAPHVIIKPRPHTFSENSPWLRRSNHNNNNKLFVSASESANAGGSTTSTTGGGGSFAAQAQPCPTAEFSKSQSDEWWESLLTKKEGDEGQEGNFMMEFFDQDFLKMEGLHNWWSHCK